MVEDRRPTPDFSKDFYAWKQSLPEEERAKPDTHARWVASVAEDNGGHAFRSEISRARDQVLEYMGNLMIQSKGIEAFGPAAVLNALNIRAEATVADGNRAISQPVQIVPIEHGLLDTGAVALAQRGALAEE